MDFFTAWLRTVWPGFVATVAALVVTFLADRVGVTIDSQVVFGAVAVILLAVIYAAGRWLEGRSDPMLQAAGRWLVSMGRDLGQPTYAKPDGGQPRAGAPPGR